MKTARSLDQNELTELLNTTSIRFPEAAVPPQSASKQEGKKCYLVCEEWKCEPNPGGTIHCECVRGKWVCE
jgi:hypothetical protein